VGSGIDSVGFGPFALFDAVYRRAFQCAGILQGVDKDFSIAKLDRTRAGVAARLARPTLIDPRFEIGGLLLAPPTAWWPCHPPGSEARRLYLGPA